MRVLIFLYLLLASTANASLPEGTWYADHLTADDGSYASFYRGWLFISEKEIDQVITLGPHYSKTKFAVVSSNENSAQIRDPDTGEIRKVFYQRQNDNLTFSFSGITNVQYRLTTQRPVIEDPPTTHPQIQIVSKWCVEQACEDLIYSDYQSERLCNLNAGLSNNMFWIYKAPESLTKKHGVDLNVMAFSYRLANDGSKLSSFSTSLFFTASRKGGTQILVKSGVIPLREGLLQRLTEVFENKNVSVELSLRQISSP